MDNATEAAENLVTQIKNSTDTFCRHQCRHTMPEGERCGSPAMRREVLLPPSPDPSPHRRRSPPTGPPQRLRHANTQLPRRDPGKPRPHHLPRCRQRHRPPPRRPPPLRPPASLHQPHRAPAPPQKERPRTRAHPTRTSALRHRPTSTVRPQRRTHLHHPELRRAKRRLRP